MITNKPHASLFLDKRYSNKDGKYGLKLTIYHSNKKKRYRTGLAFSEMEWERINSVRLKDESLKEAKAKSLLIIAKAQKIFENMDFFTFHLFEQFYFNQTEKTSSYLLKDWFETYINELKNNEQIGTAICYQTTFNSLEKFKSGLSLFDITATFLQSYEDRLTKNGKSATTCSIYLRSLRSIINKAIAKGVLKQENYSFKNFEIPGGRNIKKALDDKQLNLLLKYNGQTEKQKMALDFWKFSYFSNGINFSDIAYLQRSNINGDFLYYIRSKTKRTKKKDQRPIQVALHHRAKDIIQRLQNKDVSNPYLFPILNKGLTALQAKHRIQRFIKTVNKEMAVIATELNISGHLTTYVARHSFSTRLKRKGVSTDFIKESLGHSSITTTENYLDSFADEVKLEYSKLLID